MKHLFSTLRVELAERPLALLRLSLSVLSFWMFLPISQHYGSVKYKIEFSKFNRINDRIALVGLGLFFGLRSFAFAFTINMIAFFLMFSLL
jgi:hypothetical protein